jgi:hypothetical protein
MKESWRPGWMGLDVLRQATSMTVNGRRNRQIKSARMKYWKLKYLFEFDPTLAIYSNSASSLSKTIQSN